MRVYQNRYPVRLGAGTFSTGALDEDDIEAALKALTDIAATAKDRKCVAVPAVATSAVREAANCADFLARVRAETGLELCAISGEDEARLAALGAAPPSKGEKHRLLVDVGGGSTEVMLVAPDGNLEWSHSLPLGAVRLARTFEEMGLDTGTDPERTREITVLSPIIQAFVQKEAAIKELAPEAIAIGGTAHAVYQACVFMGHDPAEMTINTIDIMRVMMVLERIDPADVPEQLGVDRSRATILLPGALTLHSVLITLGCDRVVVSDAGVREGLVQSYLATQGHPA